MQRFRFKKGLRFNDGECQWTLQRETATKKLRFQNNLGVLQDHAKDEVLSLWQTGQWRIEDDCLEEIHDVIYMATPADIHSMPEARQKIVLRRAQYVTEVAASGCPMTVERLRPVIKAAAQKFNDGNPPHPSTVLRWIQRLGQSKDPSKIVDRRHRSGRRTSISTYAIFEKAVDEVFLTTQKNPGTVVLQRVAQEIYAHNKKVPPEDHIKIPGRATLYRWLGDLHAYLKMEGREGKAAAKLKYRSVTGTVDVKHILERVEIDHTPLDLIVIDELTSLPLGRPWLTLAIDRYSRAILGFYLAFHAPSSYSVMRCLKRCVLPKADWIKQLGGIKNTWPMSGIPMEVVFDNGMDLHSNAVALICYEMGTRVSFCPTGEPYFKGAIERMFGTLNKGLIHQLPGTTFSNIKERGDYPSEKMAVFTLAQATQLIAMWIVDVYHQRRHRSTGWTPQEGWNRQLGIVSIEFPAHPEKFDMLIGIPAIRQKISREGILFDTIHYNNSDLKYLSARIGFKKAVQFKYFEEDVGYIQVYDEERAEYIRVEAAEKYAEYANGLSRQLHLITRRWAEITYGADWMNTNLIDARRRIEGVSEQAKKSKKMAERKKSAISRGINSDRGFEDFSPLETAMSPRPDIPNFAPEFNAPIGNQNLPVFGINRVQPTSNHQNSHAA
jgi:putative transposase